jgi:hypothetical protein
MHKTINNMQMQILVVTMIILLMRPIRGEVVVFLTVVVVSIRWVYRDLAMGRHRRMMFLVDPSLQFQNFSAKM